MIAADQRFHSGDHRIRFQVIQNRIRRVLSQLVTSEPMCNRDDAKAAVPGTGDVVGRVTDDDRSSGIEWLAVPSGEALGNYGRKLEPISRIRTETADSQIQARVQPGDPEFEFGSRAEVSRQHRLDEPMVVQGSNRLGRARIRRLVPCELLLPFSHHRRQHLMKPCNPMLRLIRRNTRRNGRIHHDGLVRVAVHARRREHDFAFLDGIRPSDSPSEPTQVGGNQRAIDIPDDESDVLRAHSEHCGRRARTLFGSRGQARSSILAASSAPASGSCRLRDLGESPGWWMSVLTDLEEPA